MSSSVQSQAIGFQEPRGPSLEIGFLLHQSGREVEETQGRQEKERSFHKLTYTWLQPSCPRRCAATLVFPRAQEKLLGLSAEGFHPVGPMPLSWWMMGLAGYYSVPPRADGSNPSAHSHLHQHQRTPRLLLCPFWARRGLGLQCSPHSCTPGCHAGDCTVPGVVTVTSFIPFCPSLSHDFTFLSHSVCVSWFQIQHLGADLHPGDVLLSNHPSAGGSHLPDLTVITPVRSAALATIRGTSGFWCR